MHVPRRFAPLAAAVLVAGGLVATGAVTDAAYGASGSSRVVHGGDKAVLAPGVSGGELAPAAGPESGSAHEPVANRSESSRARSTRDGLPLTGIPATSSAVAPAAGAASFSGINHHQQRFEVAGGNQWSTEPPDQALCVGGGQVLEAVNNAVAVYDAGTGNRLALDSLNHFFGYPVEIDRSTGLAGPEQTTDPTCLFDPTTQRFFLTILTFDSDTAGNPVASGHNTLDTAVSPAGTAIGTWSVSHIDATDDGTGGTPAHPGCPCLGDYPHIGVDATGYYISTNEYPWTTGFNGSQLYAMSKKQLASGAESVTVTQLDLSRGDPKGNPGFTVWPAQSPDAGYAAAAGGTEYFLSTDAAAEANGTGRSSDLLVWSLTNTTSLATTPNLGLHVKSVPVGDYTIPPPAEQKAGSTPLADCLNTTACAKFVNSGTPDRFKESEAVLDSLDARMQQVTYARGTLYGAHGTGLDVGSASVPTAQRAGVAWYTVTPATAPNGNLSASLTGQGRLAVAGNDLVMPALIVRRDGSGWLGVTLTGHDHYPSAAAVQVVGSTPTATVSVLAEGVGPEDGFSAYRIFGGRPRWGDYGAAAVDSAGRVWLAAEWIGQTCTLAQYQAAPFGQCGGTRTALANWSTRISSPVG